jgi:hypothetical protein
MTVETDYTETNIIDIACAVTNDCRVSINGEHIIGEEQSKNHLKMELRYEGDVAVTVNGEDFHVSWEKPNEQEIQRPSGGPANGDSTRA